MIELFFDGSTFIFDVQRYTFIFFLCCVVSKLIFFMFWFLEVLFA